MSKSNNQSVLNAALALNATHGWSLFTARFKFVPGKDGKDGKWEKLSWKSAASSNGRAWGQTGDPDENSSRFC